MWKGIKKRGNKLCQAVKTHLEHAFIKDFAVYYDNYNCCLVIRELFSAKQE